ncbi:uncharacterized protein F4807DRAFT_44087 [Annulohypoxylon truncatum]|uniref:uncharacterized protein n=1 Tax=Annulohypoxylon truncatum TaxID=327061 RepID=UPI002008B265|nr:uncharacterized protein F4807DRAFT_44087 [Annulohypoxylon truncatum]KAI1210939.1 hypothetical protein F4807DRAFT_44087 [Annulohypoxylon truncatum]
MGSIPFLYLRKGGPIGTVCMIVISSFCLATKSKPIHRRREVTLLITVFWVFGSFDVVVVTWHYRYTGPVRFV